MDTSEGGAGAVAAPAGVYGHPAALTAQQDMPSVPKESGIERIGRFIAQRPRQVLLGVVTMALMLSVVSFTTAGLTIANPEMRPLNSDIKRTADSYFAAAGGLSGDADSAQEPQSVPFGSVAVIYIPQPDTPAQAMLDAERRMQSRLADVHQLEQDIVRGDTDWNEVCLKDPTTQQCRPLASVATFMYPGSLNMSGTIIFPIPDGSGDQQMPVSFLEPFLEQGADAFVTTEFPQTMQSQYLRTIFQFGGPVDQYSNMQQDTNQQYEKRDSFIKEQLMPRLQAAPDSVFVAWAGSGVVEEEMAWYLQQDMWWPAGAGLLVFLIMWYHMQSAWLASMALLNIIFSFPFAFFVYGTLAGQLMNSLNFMSVFLIIGIGADDMFILTDFWKSSTRVAVETGLSTDHVDRMVWTFARASKTMFITTLTTATSFAASISSTIPAVSAFGFFASCMVLTNYLLVCTFYMSIVTLFDLGLIKQANADAADASGGSSNGSGSSIADVVAGASGQRHAAVVAAVAAGATRGKQDVRKQHPAASARDPIVFNKFTKEHATRMQEFLGVTYAKWLQQYKMFVIVAFVILWIVSLIFAIQLITDPEAEPFPGAVLPPESRFEQFLALNGEHFKADRLTESVLVHFFWGIRDIDRSGGDPQNWEWIGRAIFDDEFDVEGHAQTVLGVCDRVNEQTSWIEERSEMCIMRNYLAWVNATGTVHESLAQGLGLFVQQPDFNGYAFAQNIGFSSDGSRVIWLSVTYTSKLRPGLSANEAIPHYDHWVEETQQMNLQLPEHLFLRQTSTAWVDMAVSLTLKDTAFWGIIVSAIVALIVLIASSRSVTLSGFAMLAISGIVLTLMAVLRISGRGLGAMESISLTTSVGLSVDYVVHISEAYKTSDVFGRKARTASALSVIGESIVAGCATTLSAASMLFPCQIVWSGAIGQFVFVDIGLSLLWSLGFFTALLMAFGPEGDRQQEKQMQRQQAEPSWLTKQQVAAQNDQDAFDANAEAVFDPNGILWQEYIARVALARTTALQRQQELGEPANLDVVDPMGIGDSCALQHDVGHGIHVHDRHGGDGNGDDCSISPDDTHMEYSGPAAHGRVGDSSTDDYSGRRSGYATYAMQSIGTSHSIRSNVASNGRNGDGAASDQHGDSAALGRAGDDYVPKTLEDAVFALVLERQRRKHIEDRLRRLEEKINSIDSMHHQPDPSSDL